MTATPGLVSFAVGDATVTLALDAVVVAGYTGRDRAAVDAHVAELAEHGIPPPATIPAYWRFPPWVASQSPTVTVVGAGTSGEAEPCLVVDGDDVWLTVASDHTDRDVEAVDIGLSKHVCPKVLATEAWPLAAVADRLDALSLRSWADGDAYQDGTTAGLVDPLALLDGMPFARPRRFALLCGTVATLGGLRPAARFRAELGDPATGATLGLAYAVGSFADGSFADGSFADVAGPARPTSTRSPS